MESSETSKKLSSEKSVTKKTQRTFSYESLVTGATISKKKKKKKKKRVRKLHSATTKALEDASNVDSEMKLDSVIVERRQQNVKESASSFRLLDSTNEEKTKFFHCTTLHK